LSKYKIGRHTILFTREEVLAYAVAGREGVRVLSGAEVGLSSDINVRGVNLSNMMLADIKMPYANFEGAEMCNTSLKRASLVGANFSGANMAGCDLSYASCRGAIFTKANLLGVTMCRTDLSLAVLTGANIINCIFDETVMHGCIMPDGSIHG
jgi:uncharacterized protein YjbI with pentapeptide repeats